MKKHGICLLPDACYLSELNVPGKPNRTNLGKCAAIQRFLSTHPNENLAFLTPYRNQRALLAGTAKKSSYPQEVSLTVHRAQGREWDTCSFSFNEGNRHWDSVLRSRCRCIFYHSLFFKYARTLETKYSAFSICTAVSALEITKKSS